MGRSGELESEWWELASFALTCKGYRISSGWMMMAISEPMTIETIDSFVLAVADVLAETDEDENNLMQELEEATDAGRARL